MAATDISSADRTHIGVIAHLIGRIARGRVIRKNAGFGMVLEAVELSLGVASPYLLKLLFDELAGESIREERLAVIVLAYGASWALTSFCSVWRMAYSSRVIDELTAQLASEALQSQLPKAAVARDGNSGGTLGQLERLPFSLNVVVDGLFWRAGLLVIQLGITLLVISTFMPLGYGAVLAVTLSIYGWLSWIGSRRQQSMAKHVNAATTTVSQFVGDILRNARRVVFNGALEREIVASDRLYECKHIANQSAIWSLVFMSGLQYGALAIGLSVLLWLGGQDVARHVLTVGDLVLLQTYALRLVAPLSGFGFILSQASVALGHLRDVVEMTTGKGPDRDGPASVAGAGSVTLEDVAFEYEPGLPSLRQISLTIAPGTFVAIVGSNGSGKSTLAQLVAGILKPGEGSVKINGVDISTLSPDNLRRFVLYVPQYVGLFNRSLGENGLYPSTRLSEAELKAQLAEWRFYEPARDIDLNMVIGEQGEKLSGGQIQKLELARILGIRTPVVILDESTSALDVRIELEIVRALRSRFTDRTTLIMITHRQEIADSADRVLHLKAGRLVT